jgi:hypothetical protein
MSGLTLHQVVVDLVFSWHQLTCVGLLKPFRLVDGSDSEVKAWRWLGRVIFAWDTLLIRKSLKKSQLLN